MIDGLETIHLAQIGQHKYVYSEVNKFLLVQDMVVTVLFAFTDNFVDDKF